MIELITNFMQYNLYISVFTLILLENIFPPIPSELVLTYAGSLVLISQINIYILILIATISSVISSLFYYYLGTKLDLQQILHLNSKLKNFGFKPSDIEKNYTKFNKHGNSIIFIARLIPVMRTLISLPAGSTRMKMKNFIIATFFGSLIWNTFLITFGYYFTDQISILVAYMKNYQTLILILISVYIIYKLFSKKTLH